MWTSVQLTSWGMGGGGGPSPLTQPLCKEKKNRFENPPDPPESCVAKPDRGQGGGILEAETFFKGIISRYRPSGQPMPCGDRCARACVPAWGAGVGSSQPVHSCSPPPCKVGSVLTVAFQSQPPPHPPTPGASAFWEVRVQGPLSHSWPASPHPLSLSVSFHFSLSLCVCLPFSLIQ